MWLEWLIIFILTLPYLKLHALVHSLWFVISYFPVTNRNENRGYILPNQETGRKKELLQQAMRLSKLSNLVNFVRNLSES